MADDHDSIIELRAYVQRILADAESEKGTRTRSNERIHQDIANLRAQFETRCKEIENKPASWYERIFWILAGAVAGALSAWFIRSVK